MARPCGHTQCLAECLGDLHPASLCAWSHFYELATMQLACSQPPPPLATGLVGSGLQHQATAILSCTTALGPWAQQRWAFLERLRLELQH